MRSHVHSGTQSKVENKTFFKKKQLSPSSEREQFETVASKQWERTVRDGN